MPNTPIKRGYTFHCLADHGYVWDFHPTSNQCGPDPVPSIEGLTATGAVVYHLCSKLPRSRYWVVYLDNLYTSVPLLARLRHDFKTGGCGTSRPSTAGFPTELKIPTSDVGKHEYHSSKKKVLLHSIFQLAVGFLLWIDNAPVSMMTTVYDLSKTVLRLRNKPGKKSTNAKAAREAFEEDEHEKEMPIPVCVDDYNHHMGGVFQADQLRSYYDTQLIAFRVWWPMLFWALDTMICNVHIIYQSIPEVPAMSQEEFRLQCAWGLINAGVRMLHLCLSFFASLFFVVIFNVVF
jgi:hypothetical protein